MRKLSELTEEEKLDIRNSVEGSLVLIQPISLLVTIIFTFVLPFNKIGFIVGIIWFLINLASALLTDNEANLLIIFLKIANLLCSGGLIYYIFTN